MSEWVVALLGVAVGFTLNEGTTLIKERIKANKYTAALNDELKSNLHQLEQKEDLAKQMIAALKQGAFLPGWSVPFASTVYEHHFPKIIQRLKPIERDNVRHIYAHLIVLDEITTKMEDSFKEDMKSDVMKSTQDAYVGRVDDVIQNYQNLKMLITKYLNNEPFDIYNIYKNNT